MRWSWVLLATAVASAQRDEGADVVEITEQDAAAIREVVRAQLQAFRAKDGRRAWELSSSSIQATFPDGDAVMALIGERYPAFLQPKQVSFGEFVSVPEGIGLRVTLSFPGRRHGVEALFLVVREPERGWRVHGAVLLPDKELELAEVA